MSVHSGMHRTAFQVKSRRRGEKNEGKSEAIGGCRERGAGAGRGIQEGKEKVGPSVNTKLERVRGRWGEN